MAVQSGDFKIFRDQEIVLSALAGGDRDHSFPALNLPGDAVVSEQCVLCFMVTKSNNARIVASINGHEVAHHRLGSSDTPHSVHEVCPANILHETVGNVVKFEVTEGSCGISDVVIWFQNVR